MRGIGGLSLPDRLTFWLFLASLSPFAAGRAGILSRGGRRCPLACDGVNITLRPGLRLLAAGVSRKVPLDDQGGSAGAGAVGRLAIGGRPESGVLAASFVPTRCW